MWPVRKSPGSRQSLDGWRGHRPQGCGHAGTLILRHRVSADPAGRATRLVPWLQEWTRYVGDRPRRRHGLVGLTGVIGHRGRSLAPAALQLAGAGLVGRISQAPPMFSAAHSGGVRLYDLARQGIEVERVEKERFVRSFEVLGVEGAFVTVRVVCSSGTYIRVLAESFGAALGLPAHLASLERTRIGPWRATDAPADLAFDESTPEAVAGWGVPLVDILSDWPRLTLDEVEARLVRNGRLPDEGAGARCFEGALPPRFRTGTLLALAARAPGQGRGCCASSSQGTRGSGLTVQSSSPGPRRLLATIGVFDGVHRGHQSLIAAVLEDGTSDRQEAGRPVLFTFDPHPGVVLAPGRATTSLTPRRRSCR